LKEYFLKVMGLLIETLGDRPDAAAVTAALNQLVELFSSLSEPPRKTVQGLWAELFVIGAATDCVEAVKCWHISATDVYDFNSGAQRVEVKSTSGSQRVHHFSLAQLNPPGNTKLLVCSIFVQRTGGGSSVGEQMEGIVGRLSGSTDQAFRFQQIVAFVLGDSFADCMDERFDAELAKSSLSFFWSADVPSVNPDVPAGVSQVEFEANLAGLPSVPVRLLRPQGGLFAAIAPR